MNGHVFDTVFGADEATINDIVAAVYKALAPSGVFHHTIAVHALDIENVTLDLGEIPPIVTLVVSTIPN